MVAVHISDLGFLVTVEIAMEVETRIRVFVNYVKSVLNFILGEGDVRRLKVREHDIVL